VAVDSPGLGRVVVAVPVFNPGSPRPDRIDAFVESDGHVSIEAAHYHHTVEDETIRWQTIAGLGRTLSSVTPFPVTAGSRTPSGASPRIEYRVHLFSAES